MEKKEYARPLCKVTEIGTAAMLASSDSNTLKVNHEPSDDFIEGAVNRNNGWDLW